MPTGKMFERLCWECHKKAKETTDTTGITIADCKAYCDICGDQHTRADANGPKGRTFAYATENGISNAGAGAKVTMGEASAKWNIFSAYAEGPNAGADAKIGMTEGGLPVEAGAMAELSLGKAGVKAGPVAAALNVNADTGAKVGPQGVEASVLGLGFSIGKKTGIKTPLGEISFQF